MSGTTPVDHLQLRTLIAVALLAVIAALAGAVFGATTGWVSFSAGVVLLLLHHMRHVALLVEWLKQPTPGKVPRGRGAWDYVFSLLYRFERVKTRQHQQLAKTLVRFRRAGRALPDGVVILNADNRIEWCNDTAETHFDLNGETDTGQPVANLVRQPKFVAYIEAGDYAQPIELRTTRGDGMILSVQIIPYGDAQKLLLSRDVTRIEKLETMRRDFVANVSHELRTPLTVLSGFLETIQELDLDRDRSRDYIKLMSEQGRRMQRIVDDLLALSTLESAPGPSLDERVRMVPLLAVLRADAEALSGGKHRIVLEAEPGFDLLGAESEIASAFGNLVSNAIRYTPEGGEVRMTWRATAREAEFAVEDTGIGIAPEHIPRLTERFYRVDRGRSRQMGGTGLGLAIVKHILNRHQATLDVTSQLGKGSRFAARFPARRIVDVVAVPHKNSV
jgi:two-component system, OmpR family, phosphate regulon sensor histidine kinase PhoR